MASAKDFRLITRRHPLENRCGPHKRSGSRHLFVGRIGLPVHDVFADGPAEEKWVLRYDADHAAQQLGVDVLHVDTIEKHSAPRRIVEARRELYERRLAGPRLSDESNLF